MSTSRYGSPISICEKGAAPGRDKVFLTVYGQKQVLTARGNGQLDAVSNAICQAYDIHFTKLVYNEHDLDKESNSRGIAYFGLTWF
jgi:2-isopropylmalate synthase